MRLFKIQVLNGSGQSLGEDPILGSSDIYDSVPRPDEAALYLFISALGKIPGAVEIKKSRILLGLIKILRSAGHILGHDRRGLHMLVKILCSLYGEGKFAAGV